jgi:hypothetical protein
MGVGERERLMTEELVYCVTWMQTAVKANDWE